MMLKKYWPWLLVAAGVWLMKKRAPGVASAPAGAEATAEGSTGSQAQSGTGSFFADLVSLVTGGNTPAASTPAATNPAVAPVTVTAASTVISAPAAPAPSFSDTGSREGASGW